MLVLLWGGLSFAYESNPQGIVSSSGLGIGTGHTNFGVAGEDVTGIIGGTGYVSGVGLATMIYRPLTPSPGEYTPVISADVAAISYPNPFNPNVETSTIAYKLAEDAEVKIYIFDVSGSLVQTIVTTSANRASDGFSRYAWNGRTGFGSTVANGVYLVQIVSGGKTIGKTKVMVVK